MWLRFLPVILSLTIFAIFPAFAANLVPVLLPLDVEEKVSIGPLPGATPSGQLPEGAQSAVTTHPIKGIQNPPAEIAATWACGLRVRKKNRAKDRPLHGFLKC